MMAHFGNKNDNCKSCISFYGFRVISIMVVGLIIGYAALQFVEPPPSVKLLLNNKHNKESTIIIRKLDSMEDGGTPIKDSLLFIKWRMGQSKRE